MVVELGLELELDVEALKEGDVEKAARLLYRTRCCGQRHRDDCIEWRSNCKGSGVLAMDMEVMALC